MEKKINYLIYKCNIKGKSGMQEYVVNRPDEGAMEQALRENPGNAAGTVLRLA